jgi:L-ascorbate metabolism protein UlaG (beta-lactamase superfamily)
MKITYLGHAGFLVESEVAVVVDPFLTGNPRAGLKPEQIQKADVVLVTHSHPDHVGDSAAIAKRTGAALVSVPELSAADEIEGVGMNFGGTVQVRGLPVTMVKAEHSCNVGDAAGFVWAQGGRTLYHMGDTSLFSDIKLIGELYRPDIVFVPIGDYYTMGPEHAAKAIAWLAPKVAIPMHFGTFPILAQSADSFRARVEKGCSAQVAVLNPGETREF